MKLKEGDKVRILANMKNPKEYYFDPYQIKGRINVFSNTLFIEMIAAFVLYRFLYLFKLPTFSIKWKQ